MIKLKNAIKHFPDSSIKYSDYIFMDCKSYLVLGASGSGKSTLLNMIAGVISPSEGEIYIDDVDILSQSQVERDHIRTTKIGYIYQDFKLIEEMTVEDNIRILEICGIKSQEFEKVTKELEINDKLRRKVKTLSGGEKQRVAIARALVKKPSIILADEPTGSLNFEIGDVIVKKLLECTKEQLLIFVTHDTRLKPLFDVVIDLSEGGKSND